MIFQFLIRYDSQGLIPDYLVEDQKPHSSVAGRGVWGTATGIVNRIPSPELREGIAAN
jgi:hypothetical protein